jgi:hypothetical protein
MHSSAELERPPNMGSVPLIQGGPTHACMHRFILTILHLNPVRSLDLCHTDLLQDVCQMITHSHELNLNSPFSSTLTNEVLTNLNVLTSPMVNWILDEINCRLVVHLQQTSSFSCTQYLESDQPYCMTSFCRRCLILCLA